MRTDLQVPYEEKDAAKALGACWDMGRRTWYVENREDLTPFLRWMPIQSLMPHVRSIATRELGCQQHPRPRVSKAKVTTRTNPSLPECGCSAPPWEHCEHTRR